MTIVKVLSVEHSTFSRVWLHMARTGRAQGLFGTSPCPFVIMTHFCSCWFIAVFCKVHILDQGVPLWSGSGWHLAVGGWRLVVLWGGP